MNFNKKNILEKVSIWNQTEVLYPRNSSVHELFGEISRQTPQAPALVLPGWEGNPERILSYKQLDTLSSVLAGKFQKNGWSNGKNIAIVLDRSIEMVIALLGILKAGCAYVPLDAQYPGERLEYLLKDIEAPVIVTQRSFESQLKTYNIPLLVMDSGWEETGEEFTCTTSADAPAYIIYTSGSTGKPKGVCVPHRGIVRLVKNNSYAEFDNQQIFLHLAPPTFDASTFELWGPLLNGGCCVLFPYEGVPDPSDLETITRNYHVTTLWLTASLFNMIISEAPHSLRYIKQLLTGGEALSVKHVRKALELLPDTQLINGYGPTECTTFSCCYSIPRSIEPLATSIPIGKPIANSTAYILDESMSPVPVGAEGDLYLGGDGVALEYLHRPDLTMERFIPDPFDKRPGQKLYKTGDKARFLEGGNIDFIGRIDDQVKIHGFRIELGEIVAALELHQAIESAAVAVRVSADGDKRIIGYICGRGNAVPDITQVQDFLKQRLPEYMLPSALMVLPALPLGPNGKLDRSALPDPGINEANRRNDYIAPATDLEKNLARLWGEILAISNVGVLDNFFDIGGNSLLSMQLATRMSQLLGKHVAVVKLYQFPTVRALAEHFAPASNVISDGFAQRATQQRSAFSRFKKH